MYQGNTENQRTVRINRMIAERVYFYNKEYFFIDESVSRMLFDKTVLFS
jgi:hypothetical protein